MGFEVGRGASLDHVEVDGRVEVVAVQGGGDQAVVDAEQAAEELDGTGAGGEVADVALEAVTGTVRPGPKTRSMARASARSDSTVPPRHGR